MSAPLLELLFVREAWDLSGTAGLPACAPRPDAGRSSRPSSALDLEATWDESWAVRFAGGADESWRGRFGQVDEPGDTGIDGDALRAWKNPLREAFTALAMRSHARTDPRFTDALERARRAGVDQISVLPLTPGWSLLEGTTFWTTTTDVADGRGLDLTLREALGG
ncbi:hypothetical protein [Sediminihabitans luteus]|nr:hypothetical protein [Sediminihabitans luteus]